MRKPLVLAVAFLILVPVKAFSGFNLRDLEVRVSELKRDLSHRISGQVLAVNSLVEHWQNSQMSGGKRNSMVIIEGPSGSRVSLAVSFAGALFMGKHTFHKHVSDLNSSVKLFDEDDFTDWLQSNEGGLGGGVIIIDLKSSEFTSQLDYSELYRKIDGKAENVTVIITRNSGDIESPELNVISNPQVPSDEPLLCGSSI